MEPPQPALPSPPPFVSDHELLRVIGEGSYGEVWLARNAVGTLRAVKVVHARRFSSDRPFQREFNGLQVYEPISRSQEGLMDILQLGRNEEDGYFYYVMELADAVQPDGDYQPLTLRALARRHGGRVPFADCLRHFISLAGGLDALHRASLSHRDIKPSNIIVVRGVAKLADIGLVAEMSESRSYVGTEGFIPPEGPGTVAADIYALGKVFYEVATGMDRLEFPSLPLMRGEPDKEMLELNAIAARACAPDVPERYTSAAEMMADLALLQSGRSVREYHRNAQRLRFARRAGAAAAAVALLAVMGFAWAQWQSGIERRAREEKERLLSRAESAERASRRSLYEQALALARAECYSPEPGHRFRALNAVAEVAKEHPGDAALRDSVIMALAVPDMRPLRTWAAPEGFPSSVTRVPHAIDPTAARFVQTDRQGNLRLVRIGPDPASDVVERTIPGPGYPPADLGPFSPDGKYIVVIAQDHSMIVYEFPAWKVVHQVSPETGAQSAGRCSFSRDSRHFVLLQPNGLLVQPLPGGEARFISVPGPRLAAMSDATHPRLVAVTTRQGDGLFFVDLLSGAVQEGRSPSNANDAVSLDPGGEWIASPGEDGRIYLQRLQAKDETSLPIAGHQGFTPATIFHPDGDLMVTASWDRTGVLFGVGDQRLISRTTEPLIGASFLSRTRFAGSEMLSCRLVLMEVAGREACRAIAVPPRADGTFATFDLDFLGDGSTLALATPHAIQLHDSETGRLTGCLRGESRSIAATRETGVLHSSTPAGVFEIPMLPDSMGALHPGLPQKRAEQRFEWLKISPHARTLLGVSGNALLVSRDGEPFRQLGGRCVTGAVSPDGQLAAVRIWDTTVLHVTDHKVLGQFPLNGTPVFSRDSRWIYGVTRDVVQAYEIESGRLLWERKLAGGPGLVCALTDDGVMLAVTVNDGSIALFDAKEGQLLATLAHPVYEMLERVVFNPQGDKLACITAGRGARIWNLKFIRDRLREMGLDW